MFFLDLVCRRKGVQCSEVVVLGGLIAVREDAAEVVGVVLQRRCPCSQLDTISSKINVT